MRTGVWQATLFIAVAVSLPCSGQDAPPPLQQPWEGVPERYRNLPLGKFEEPRNAAGWKAKRARVKQIVLGSLGDVPPRPSPLQVRVVATDQKDGYRIEKFVFDNGTDSMVPGYIFE